VLLGATHYGCPVDMWSVGCIFAELVRKQPLFPGDSEFQQLLHIFKLLGTPSEGTWQGVSRLKDWHEYPKWKPADLTRYFPDLEPAGLDLMRQLFEYDPAARISAKDCLSHPYFDGMDRRALDAMENPEVMF